MKRQTTSGWGLFPVVEAVCQQARFAADLPRAVADGPPLLGQGNRRSYGDACLGPRVLSTLGMDNLLSFDSERGVLRAEAGATLDKIIRFALPRGFFLPVTPGTKFPTLGGCIAADVHGKNHHVDGSLSSFIDELEMVLADGRWVRCSRTERSDLFWATLGGMGLTGLVYAATLRLRPVTSAYIDMRSVKTRDFEEACRIFAETRDEYIYSVAWIDCLARGARLGRSLVMLGNHAEARPGEDEPLRLHPTAQRPVPFFFPEFVLNRWSMQAFNTLYYHKQWRRTRQVRVHYEPFFYPLDMLADWNRIYGRRGFVQYQFAIPFDGGLEVMRRILERIAARGTASFLAVLKTFGPQEGLLAFPMPGFTLALDLPLSDRSLLPFLQGLTKIVVEAGGRVYLAKDAVVERADFEAMYPGLDEFKRIKRRYDPDHLFRSHQSDRLGIT